MSPMRVRRQPAKGRLMVMALSALAVLVAACGGGDGSTPTAANREQAQSESVRIPDASALFAWAQRAYADVFAGTPTPGSAAGYDYLYYPSTGYAIGVSGSTVAVYGPVFGNTVVPVGTLADLRCSVFAADCANWRARS